ncbi:hypothetical protein TIFTF001_045936 [Ficus carica]|uniref:Uncharacterized protein n=1 Tax=Ficus carica TaxID=3494 RepID=A0AA88CPY4_FICCA|nr:hypothetical protein TIFTF001_045931 [Ficus carica]GMN25312.1 hypothetical protein TIFTF001_045936 [Ficus carica]
MGGSSSKEKEPRTTAKMQGGGGPPRSVFGIRSELSDNEGRHRIIEVGRGLIELM